MNISTLLCEKPVPFVVRGVCFSVLGFLDLFCSIATALVF